MTIFVTDALTAVCNWNFWKTVTRTLKCRSNGKLMFMSGFETKDVNIVLHTSENTVRCRWVWCYFGETDHKRWKMFWLHTVGYLIHWIPLSLNRCYTLKCWRESWDCCKFIEMYTKIHSPLKYFNLPRSAANLSTQWTMYQLIRVEISIYMSLFVFVVRDFLLKQCVSYHNM